MVRVRRQWNNYRIGEVDLAHLHSIRWDSTSGGVGARTPQPFIHGNTTCTAILGDIAHSCRHGPPPHWIKVCVVKKDNSKEVWQKVNDIAGPKPKS